MPGSRFVRIRKKVEADLLRRPARTVAALQRRRLTRPVFVGITGTAGKTTTNELTAAVLSRLGPGVKSEDGYNTLRHVVKCLLRTRQRHYYCVQELGAPAPGVLDEMVRCFRPDIGVVLNVGLEHYTAYRTPDAVALEKGRLVEVLPWSGTAILNADDPRVLAMHERTSANVVTFGLGPGADVRAENIHSAWPEPLRLDVVCDDRTQRVETQLHGEHWASAVLAAFAVGRCLGVSASDAAAAIAGTQPVAGRFDTIKTPTGAVFVCDDLKFPYWNAGTFLDVVAKCQAERKFIVFGTMSDYGGSASPKFRAIARQALEVADVVIFIGERFASALQSVTAETNRLMTYPDIDQTEQYLRDTVGHGDVVFLKGSQTDGLRSIAGAVPLYSQPVRRASRPA